MAPIDLAEEPLRGKIELMIDAVSEMFYSLHVLAEPAHHLANRAWAAQAMARMTSALREDVQYFGRVFNQWLDISDLIHAVRAPGNELEPFVQGLLNMSPSEVVEIALHGLGHEILEYVPEPPTDPEILAVHADVQARPGEFVSRLVRTLEGYWREIFAQEWERRRPLLEQRYAREAARLDTMEPLDWLTGLTPRITYDREREELVFHKVPELRFAPAQFSKIRCLPSTFTPPHLMVGYAYQEVTICLNVPLTLTAPEVVPMRLLLALKALADETRLRIFKLVVRQPAYTQELAKALKLAEPTVSRHLKLLQAAGLVSSRKDGPVMRYAGSLDLVEQLPALLREFIRS
jgi:DNA-binding transcriptional ArsR family regulator